MKSPFAYLAGAIEKAPDNGAAWREEISQFLENRLGHSVFNPCREESHILTPEEFRNFRGWKSGNMPRFREVMHKIIHTDLSTLLNKVDYIICLWDEHVQGGGGTQGELTMAFWHKIPVYLVTDIPVSEISSWILGCTTELFSDFESLKTFLLDKYSSGDGAE